MAFWGVVDGLNDLAEWFGEPALAWRFSPLRAGRCGSMPAWSSLASKECPSRGRCVWAWAGNESQGFLVAALRLDPGDVGEVDGARLAEPLALVSISCNRSASRSTDNGADPAELGPVILDKHRGRRVGIDGTWSSPTLPVGRDG